MNRRPAVTLMEVLIAMFIMAIGMMALMALFPVGAVSMAQALKDDRCAYASSVSDNVAIVNNIRYGDANVSLILNNLLLAPTGLVYVDPYGVSGGMGAVGLGSAPVPIQRVSPLFVGSASSFASGLPPLIDRWFSLQDDMGYNLSGYPDTSNTGGIVDRGRRYSFAYLLRQQRSLSASTIAFANVPSFGTQMPVQLYAVVYQGRPVYSLTTTPTEYVYPTPPSPAPIGAIGANNVILPGVSLPGLKRGGWILEPANGFFYRVTNIVELGGTTTVELQQSLRGNLPTPVPITQIIAMDFVAEVFEKGTGWQQ